MNDLNNFVSLISPLTLTTATFINDRGEIAAQAILPNGDQRAVLLVPCADEESDADSCKGDEDGASTSFEVTGATIAPTPTAAPKPKDRLRALWSNWRFHSYPQK